MSSPFKQDWPYIQYLTRDEIKAYTSTLPKNLDELKVNQLNPTEIWIRERIASDEPVYNTEAQAKLEADLQIRAGLWLSLYATSLMLGMLSTSRWYNANVIKNYTYFRTETWPQYLKLRIWPGVFISWTVMWVYTQKLWSSYPTPQFMVNWLNK